MCDGSLVVIRYTYATKKNSLHAVNKDESVKNLNRCGTLGVVYDTIKLILHVWNYLLDRIFLGKDNEIVLQNSGDLFYRKN